MENGKQPARVIKFRQPIVNREGVFIEWHYWGMVDGQWQEAAIHQNGHDTRAKSMQLAWVTKDGEEVYCCDNVLVKGTKRIGQYETLVGKSRHGFTLLRNDTYLKDDSCLTCVIKVTGNVYDKSLLKALEEPNS